MLRFDYEPNKCIFAPQDIILDKGSQIWNIKMNKTSCNLYTN